jgi:hypothetical protein
MPFFWIEDEQGRTDWACRTTPDNLVRLTLLLLKENKSMLHDPASFDISPIVEARKLREEKAVVLVREKARATEERNRKRSEKAMRQKGEASVDSKE